MSARENPGEMIGIFIEFSDFAKHIDKKISLHFRAIHDRPYKSMEDNWLFQKIRGCSGEQPLLFAYLRGDFQSEYIRNTVEPRMMPTAMMPAMAAVCRPLVANRSMLP